MKRIASILLRGLIFAVVLAGLYAAIIWAFVGGIFDTYTAYFSNHQSGMLRGILKVCSTGMIVVITTLAVYLLQKMERKIRINYAKNI